MPCKSCLVRQSTLKRPGGQIEFTTDSIKHDRKVYAQDILTPHRKGQLSKEWLKVYGKDKAKQHGFTDTEIKHAKNVWSGDISFYREEE
jgi:hypothetical protein